MSQSKHTAGPWEYHRKKLGVSSVLEITADKVYAVAETTWDSDVDEANARLIVASPELLDVCKYCLQRIKDSEEWWMDSPERGGFDTVKIEAAIKKATS